MLLKNCWYVAAWSKDVGRQLLERTIANEMLMMYRTEDGRAIVLENRCPHRNLPLSRGALIGDRVQCGYHGMEFDPHGRCVHAPGEDDTTLQWACVRSYPAEERYGWLFVWMGNPVLADPKAIPDFHRHMVDLEWYSVTGQAFAKCGYRLVLDNLLDLSHTAYVHTSFSGNPEVAELAKVNAEVVNGMVRVTRLMRDIPPAPAFVKYGGYNGNINRWQVGRYSAPSFIYIVNGSTPAEQSLDSIDTTSSNGRWGWEVYHAVTPETDTTSHQFWAVSLPRKFLHESMHQEFDHQAVVVIDEDLAIYEAQQACINSDQNPLASDVSDVNAKGALKFDDGLLKVRGIIRRLYAQEQRVSTEQRKAEAH